MKQKLKRILPVVLLAAAIGIFLYVSDSSELIGEMQADIVPHSSEVSGKLLSASVELGQPVKKGDTLAVIDSQDQEAAIAQLEIELEQAMLALGQAKGGSGSTTGNALLTAQSAYNSAFSTAKLAREYYETGQILYEEGAITKDALDKLQLAADNATDAVSSASARLSDAGNKYSAENSQLNVSKLQLQLSEARRQLDKYTVKASCDGTVISRSYSPGAFISPGFDIIDVSSDKERYIVAYVPVEAVSDLKYGQTILVTFEGGKYEGVLQYLDVKSQYTPKDFKTSADKNRKTVKIKIRMAQDCPIKPGQTATVEI